MSEDNLIYFAIFALDIKQANEVINELYGEDERELASWLETHKSQIYGEEVEDWKPFEGEKLIDLICADSECYESATSVIKEMPENYDAFKKLRHLRVFFVDIFSVYTDQFKAFAIKADWYFTEFGIKNCCILINYELPIDGQKHLENKFAEIWPFFKECYKEGALHRISGREEDVKNFKNYLQSVIFGEQNGIDPDMKKALEKLLGYGGKEIPSFKGGEK